MAAEKNFENKVKKYLKTKGAWTLKYWGGGGFTKAGIPDLLICSKGRFIGCELKAERGRPSDLQIKTLHDIGEAGGIPVLLYPKDFDLFRTLIETGHGEDYFRKDVESRYAILVQQD